MKIIPDPSTLVEINIKRFYLPFVVTDPCPTCGKEASCDLYQDGSYISYPSLVKPEAIYFYCEPCRKEWAGWVQIRFSLTPCDAPAQTEETEEEKDAV